MRLPIVIAVLLAASRSVAQPGNSAPDPEPGPTALPAPPVGTACQVNIVRAPEDVRCAIETWVRGEAACQIALDVRVIPTDGGLYLLAQDSKGRVHERLVPDAQAAGVLVASWVANDSIQPLPVPPPAALPRVSRAPKTAPLRPHDDHWPSTAWWSLRETFRGTGINTAQMQLRW
jgi:hypothetical protein